jgi:hypothetical protein
MVFRLTSAMKLQEVISKLQLAAAMPPPARKHTIFKDNNHVVLGVLFDRGMLGLKGPRNPLQGVLLCPLGLALGYLGADDERAAVERSKGTLHVSELCA